MYRPMLPALEIDDFSISMERIMRVTRRRNVLIVPVALLCSVLSGSPVAQEARPDAATPALSEIGIDRSGLSSQAWSRQAFLDHRVGIHGRHEVSESKGTNCKPGDAGDAQGI
jgi:hypothetical protein